MQGTCTENLHLIVRGNAVNRKNIKTIGKHREVVEKALYKCTSEGLINVATWYHGNPGPKFTKIWEQVSIGQTLSIVKFCCTVTNSVPDICCRQIVDPLKR